MGPVYAQDIEDYRERWLIYDSYKDGCDDGFSRFS